MTDQADDDGLDGQRAADARSPGFSTVVEVDEAAPGRPADALPEVVSRMPGASVRSLGGLGQFAAISVRGSSAQQVQVFIEGVPVTDSAAGLSSLGDFPLDALHRVELHRGLVPVEFGGATIGGALNLVGRRGSTNADATPDLGVNLGLGSFGGREARGWASVPLPSRGDDGRWAISTRVGYAGATGNFNFLDTNGTPQFEDDDVIATRTNNGYDRVLAQLRFDGVKRGLRWHAQQLVTYKVAGVAGPATAQSEQTRFRTMSTRTIGGVKSRAGLGPGGHLEWLFGVGFEQRIFEDPVGEVGLGVDDQRARTLDAYISPRVRVPVWRGGWLTAVADHRTEWIDVDQRAPTQGLPNNGDGQRSRFAFGSGLSLEQWLFGRRWSLVPTVRLDGFVSQFALGAGQGELGDGGRDRTDLGFSPRVGTKVVLADGLDLRASAGRYFRVPTMRELFGDQGWFLGNEALAPERGTSVDGGFVLDHAIEAIHGRGYAHVAGFGSFSQDTITWVQTGPVVQPRNVPGALSTGVETGGQLDVWRELLRVTGNYTFNHTARRSEDASEDGQPLPGRPRHEAFVRPSLGWRFEPGGFRVEPRVHYTLDFASQTFLDPSGRFSLPPRVFHGIGAALDLNAHVKFGAEVRNLTDRIQTTWQPLPGNANTQLPYPVVDFVNYPLPGRSVWINLTLTPSR